MDTLALGEQELGEEWSFLAQELGELECGLKEERRVSQRSAWTGAWQAAVPGAAESWTWLSNTAA